MPRPGRMTTERAKDFKGTLRQLLQTMSHYKLPLITAIVFAILSTIFNIAGPKVLPPAGSPSCAAPAASTLCISVGCCCFCWACTC